MSAFSAPIESIEPYMNQIKQYKRLSTKEENELAEVIQGDAYTEEEKAVALEALVNANLRLVVKVAHDFKACGLSFPDLVGEGNIGLITAAKRYSPSHGVHFGCYASIWIKQAIRAGLSNKSRTIRLPIQCVGKLRKLNLAKDAFIADNNRPPTDEELAAASGVSVVSIDVLKHAATRVYSMDDKVRDDDDTTFGDMLGEQDDERNREQQFEHVHDLLKRNMDRLSDRARMIVELYFGIGKKQCALKQIAQVIGRSTECANRMFHDAIAELKIAMKRDGVRSSVA